VDYKEEAVSCEGRQGLTPALFRAADACQAKLESALSTLGLSLPKFHVLDHLVQAGAALPLGELASRNACVKSNMTALIDRLEADGLVVRSQDPTDRRSVRAQLTNAGAERHAQASRLLESEEQSVVAVLNDRERRDLETLLERLAAVTK
jgi:MarR family transcriptional regulator, 2-MHQ and catechol-resistance regulon repressor